MGLRSFRRQLRERLLVGGLVAGGLVAGSLGGCTTSARPAARPTTSSTTTAPAPPTTAAPDDLIAYGATTSSWAANHTPDPAGTGYWPRLPDDLDAYTDVSVVAGKVESYEEHLYPAVDLATAIGIAKNELPVDAQLATQQVRTTCALVVFTSATVVSVTGADVAARLTSAAGAFDPGGVTQISFSPVQWPASSPPAC